LKIQVEELDTTLSQSFTLTNGMSLTAVRPYIYKHLNPSGSLLLEVKSGATVLTSKTILISEIITNVASNYFHGFYTFTLDNEIFLTPGTYTIDITGSGGYTFSELAFIGWVRDYNDLIYSVDNDTTSKDIQKPLTFQLWGYK